MIGKFGFGWIWGFCSCHHRQNFLCRLVIVHVFPSSSWILFITFFIILTIRVTLLIFITVKTLFLILMYHNHNHHSSYHHHHQHHQDHHHHPHHHHHHSWTTYSCMYFVSTMEGPLSYGDVCPWSGLCSIPSFKKHWVYIALLNQKLPLHIFWYSTYIQYPPGK